MKYGLPTATIEKMHAVLARFPHVERAVLYGSRAKGNFKPGSDIDLTLFGEDLDSSQLGKIAAALDDLFLPYTIDLSIYAELNHAKLREHIDRVGVVFYERGGDGERSAAAGMKTGWERKRFEDCIEPVEYTRKVQRKDFLLEGQFPIVSQEAEFTNGFWNDEADVFKVSKPVVIFGDHTQVLKYVDFDFVLGADGVKILQPRNFLCPKFFFYQLQAAELPSLGYARHYRLLKELEFCVPPLPEQRRIVALLDEAFAGLATAQANAERNLQNARALFDSHLQSVFTQRGKGWVEKPFEDCIEDVKYTTKVQRKEFLAEGRFPIVSQKAEFTNGFWNDPADVFRVATPVVIFGDHTQVLKYIDFDFVLGADGVKILEAKPELLPKFFFYQLRSIPLKSLGYARHYRLLKEVQMAFPKHAEQQAIVTRLDALSAETRRLAAIYEQKQAALAALKKSLLHQAFAGEL